MFLAMRHIGIIFLIAIGLAGCFGAVRTTKPSWGDKAISYMPTPPPGLIDTNGQCIDSPVLFVSETAKQNAGWLISGGGYNLMLLRWANRHFGERAIKMRANPNCYDGSFAARAWQATLGSSVTGTLTEAEGKRLVDIVDKYEPSFVTAKKQMIAEAAERKFQKSIQEAKPSDRAFSAFGFTLGAPLRRPWCGGKGVSEPCWMAQSSNVWGYLAGERQEPPGKARGWEKGLLRIPKSSIPFSNTDSVEVQFYDGILVEVFIDYVYRQEKNNIAQELRRIFGPAEPAEESCRTSQLVDQYDMPASAAHTVCGVGNNFKGHPDMRRARLACFQPAGRCQVTLNYAR